MTKLLRFRESDSEYWLKDEVVFELDTDGPEFGVQTGPEGFEPSPMKMVFLSRDQARELFNALGVALHVGNKS